MPNHAYSLDLHTSFFELRDIPLQHEKECLREEVHKGVPGYYAYNIDLYSFSANINLKNSELYQQKMIDKQIDVDMKVIFNQEVLRDFNMEYREIDRKKFVDAVDKTEIKTTLDFSNTFSLTQPQNTFYLTSDKKTTAQFNVQDFNLYSEPLNNILEVIIDNQNPTKIKNINFKLKYQIDGTGDWHEFSEQLPDQIINNNHFIISLNNSYEFDIEKKEIHKTVSNNRKGIFIPMNAAGFLSFDFELENNAILRSVTLEKEFSFNNTYYQNSVQAIRLQLSDEKIAQYMEVSYGK